MHKKELANSSRRTKAVCNNTLSALVQLSEDLVRLKEHYERKMRDLMANTVGTVELQQLKHKHEQKVKEKD